MTKDEIITQSPTDVRLQRYRFSLLCSGNAMILFAIWTVVRSIFLLYGRTAADAALAAAGWNNALIAAAVILGAVELIIKLYVGFSARAEGLGSHRKRGYIVPGILIAALSAYSVFSIILNFPSMYKSDGLIALVVSLAVEVTVLYASLDLIVSALKVRKLAKETGAQEAA